MTFKKRIQAFLLCFGFGWSLASADLAAPVTSPTVSAEIAADVKRVSKAKIKDEDSFSLPSISAGDPKFVATFVQSCYTDYCQAFRVAFKSTDKDYILGYYGEGEKDLPLSCSYDVKKANGKKETRYYSVSLTSQINPYDGVGPLIGSSSLTLNFDIPKMPDETIDRDSFYIYHVFPAIHAESVYQPDLTKECKIDTFKTKYETAENINLSKYYKARLTKISSFGRYVSFDVSVNNEMDKLYSEINPDLVKENANDVKKGKRFLFANFPTLKDGFIRLQYHDGKVIDHFLRDISTSNYLNAKKGSFRQRFVMKDISVKNLKRVSLRSVTFNQEYRSVETNKRIQGSEYEVRFGGLDFHTDGDDATKVKYVNVTLLLVILLFVFAALAVGASMGLYFYRKNKYKNDEFRRVNRKLFIRTSIHADAASAIVFFDVLFIVLRATLFHNSLEVYNPLDNFIIVLTVASIIYIGYWIKVMVQTIKDIQTQKSMAALNQDTKDDDGTN